MVNDILTILGLLGISLLAIFGFRQKEKILEVINKNDGVINGVKSKDSQIATNNVFLSEEEMKRERLNENVKERDWSGAEQDPKLQQELLDFFNKEKK